MTNDCVFCDRTKFEERLIGECEDFWKIATLGQISDGGYVLLTPKRHVSCVGDMEKSEIDLLASKEKKMGIVLSREYKTRHIAFFEHGIVGQTVKHAHLHFIPEKLSITKRIKKDFPDSEIASINSWNELRKLYKEKQKPYLLWRDADLETLVCWNPPAPPQYLRIVVAEALGRPERANWRNMDPELDKRLWQETVKRLKPYFS